MQKKIPKGMLEHILSIKVIEKRHSDVPLKPPPTQIPVLRLWEDSQFWCQGEWCGYTSICIFLFPSFFAAV